MQGTQVESLVGEIRSHMLWGDEVCAPQLLSLCTLEPMFQNKRSLCASTKILYNAMKIQHRKKKINCKINKIVCANLLLFV